MKNYFYTLMFVSLLAGSCSSDVDTENVGEIPGNELLAVSSDFEYDYSDADVLMRSSVFLRESGSVGFAWDKDDEFAVFSEDKGLGFYPVTNVSDDGLRVEFEGAGFVLDDDKEYYAFSKSSMLKDKALNPEANVNRVVMTYADQRMEADASMLHLGAYDYQAASSIANDKKVRFVFKHLGAVLRTPITLPAGMPKEEFMKFELQTDDNYEYQYERWVDLENAPQELQFDAPVPNSDIHTFAVDLGADAEHGIVKNAGELLTVYMMIPGSAELQGRSIYGILTAKSGNKYFISFTGKQFVGGKAYNYSRTATRVDGVTVNITVDALWESGQTQSVTRAASTTGDVGVSELKAPTHLYIYMVNNGSVCQIEAIEDIPVSDWNFVGNKWVYQKTYIPSAIAEPNGIKAYIIASNGTVASTSAININDTEEELRNLMISANVAEQVKLANLYSTPYIEDGFTGTAAKIGGAWAVNATLRHVAAKVDLNWESETSKVNGFRINNLLEEGLVFRQTENANALSGVSYEYLTTPATEHYGRQCVYVLQYDAGSGQFPVNVTWTKNTSGVSTEDVMFTPTSTYGSASWVKAKITVE